jgi:hypothetical protein
MAIVILGGLSVFPRLNRLMLSALALRFGKYLLCSPANSPLLASKAARQKMRKRALRAESGMNIAEYRLRQAATNQRPEKDKGVGLTTS